MLWLIYLIFKLPVHYTKSLVHCNNAGVSTTGLPKLFFCTIQGLSFPPSFSHIVLWPLIFDQTYLPLWFDISTLMEVQLQRVFYWALGKKKKTNLNQKISPTTEEIQMLFNRSFSFYLHIILFSFKCLYTLHKCYTAVETRSFSALCKKKQPTFFSGIFSIIKKWTGTSSAS